MATMKLLGGLCVAASASACMAEAPAELSQIVLEARPAPDCDVWGCGTNSAYFEDKGFYRLHLDGTPNEQGFAATNFRKGPTKYRAWDVVGGRMIVSSPEGSGPADIADYGLVGASFDVTLDGENRYVVTFVDFDMTETWAKQRGSGQKVYTYQLLYTDHPDWKEPTMAGESQNVCPRAPSAADALGMNVHNVLFFEGENIDAVTKTVIEIDRNFVNIGCAGSALAKMHLTSHTDISARQDFETTLEERQTMLKMLVGDYCGNGNAHTIGGQPLSWADDKDWMNLPNAPSYLEAMWTPQGAKCLNKTRLEVNPPPAGVDAPIAEDCMKELSGCSDGNPSDPPAPFHLISSNPL